MIFILKQLLSGLQRTVETAVRSAETRVHRATVGKVEAKIGQAQNQIQQKALRAVNNVGRSTPPQASNQARPQSQVTTDDDDENQGNR